VVDVKDPRLLGRASLLLFSVLQKRKITIIPV
jgi:hypothetical protein